MSFLDKFKLYGESKKTLRNTRRALLTKNGFVILSEVEDSEEFTKSRANLESQIQELGKSHKQEVNTYLAQGFLDLGRPPTGAELKERLNTQAPFRAGFEKIRSKQALELAELTGKLKGLVEKNEWAKQDARKEQFKSLTPQQRKDLVNESARKRYQTEEGKAKRTYHNINHYAVQGERIRQVQQERYQNNPEFRATQIERAKTRQKKPGMRELGAAEARERTRINRDGLGVDCSCGCKGELKTHRKNFRIKFWSEFNLPKEGGFKIYVAGVDMDAYWAGEDWNNCLTAAKKKKPGVGRVTPKKVDRPTTPNNFPSFPKPQQPGMGSSTPSGVGSSPALNLDDYKKLQPNGVRPVDTVTPYPCPECNGSGCHFCTDGKITSIDQLNGLLHNHTYNDHRDKLEKVVEQGQELQKTLPPSFQKSESLIKLDKPRLGLLPPVTTLSELSSKHDTLIAPDCHELDRKYRNVTGHFMRKYMGDNALAVIQDETDQLHKHLEEHHGIKINLDKLNTPTAHAIIDKIQKEMTSSKQLPGNIDPEVFRENYKKNVFSMDSMMEFATGMHQLSHLAYETHRSKLSRESIIQHMSSNNNFNIRQTPYQKALVDLVLEVKEPNQLHLINPVHQWKEQ